MAIVTPDADFARWLSEPEGVHLEFKRAENSYPFDELIKYCCALANEGGGKFILGVTDKRPRMALGTQAFLNPNDTVHRLLQGLHLRVDFEERTEAGRRVLILHVPGRPLGRAIALNHIPWMRSGESLVPMTQDILRSIHDETGPDYSAEVCARAKLEDLDSSAIEIFRASWIKKSGNEALRGASPEQLLRDAELLMDEGVTNAALVLFGTYKALGRLGLSHAEIIFEYRSSEHTDHQDRETYRKGFFLCYDEVWQRINLRNEVQSYRSGLFHYDIPTFSETVIREALLNAISHRDYRLGSSVFVRQFPRHMEIVSPGGFPAGITPDNVLEQQNPRNRRIAEAFAKCGLIERSGQGMNRIYEESIKQSKALPDFTGSASHEVRLVLHGEVQNPAFLHFLEKVAPDVLDSFSTADWLVLNYLHRTEPLPERLHPRLAKLKALGVAESIGRGRGTRYFLSRALYAHMGQTGAYTREVGLDRETNKELLLKHLRDSPAGSSLSVLQQVLPSLSINQVRHLLRELSAERRAFSQGKGRGSLWFPGQNPENSPDPLPN